MKNLKKLISVIIAVIMLVSSFATVAAADYADVESTDSYYKAIKVLSGLGIAKGDEEGNFNPENEVKRSEMVAFICRAMGEEDIATASSSNAFADVAANHWAAGYIAWGVNRGIINGMGDGTFAPDAAVSYQDAVVMIMRALGYDRIAQRAENGGYPTGYLKLASQYGVLKDAGYDNTAAASREIIAQLIYNALTAPLVDVSYYGVSVEDDRYVIYNGKNGTDLRTLLTYTNEVLKVKAEVTKTPKANPTTCIDKNGNYMVEIDITDAYDYSVSDVVTELGADPALVYVGETEAADLLGTTVEAYIAEDEDLNDWKLLAVIADTKSVVKETIDENLSTIVVTTGKVSYYADMNDRKMTEIDIAATPTVYYNGVEVSASDITTAFTDLETLLNTDADSITFMGDKNAPYDKIFVTDYIYKRVKAVNAAEKLIKFEGAGSVDLDAESRNDEDFIYGIYDANGKAMDIADIKEGDVLNIVCPLDGTTVGNYFSVDYLDIYVTNETVTGKVDEYKTTTGQYVIDGKAYTSTIGLTISEEGIFFLTIDGKIMDKEAATTVSKNFAFVMAIEEDIVFSVPTYTVRLFKADGAKEDFVVAETMKFFNGSDTATVLKRKDGTQATEFGGSGGFFYDAVADESSESNAKAKLANRFVTYKTNSANEITELRIAAAGTAIEDTIWATKKYNAEFGEFGGETIGDAVLFVAEASEISSGVWNVDPDDVEIANFAALDEDDDTLNAKLYMVDGEDELAAVLLDAKPGLAFAHTSLAVVQSLGTKLDADDQTVESITFVQGGELVTLTADYDAYPSGTSLAVGDIFQYAVNTDNEIEDFELVYDAGSGQLDAYATGLNINDHDVAFVFGVIAELDDYIVLSAGTDYEAPVACDHVHDASCAYVEGVACDHVHDASCAYVEGVACDHVHDASCGGVADAAACTHVHGSCAYVEGVACDHVHGSCAYVAPVACDHVHGSCAYYAGVAGTGKLDATAKFKFNEAEGATYAWYEEAAANNPVKVITIDGLRETVRANAVYAAVAKVNESGRVEDVVVIALNPSAFNSWDDIDNFGYWNTNPND